MEKEHGIPSLDGAPLPSHAGLVLPHSCLNLDLRPKTIRCYYDNNGMSIKRKLSKFRCKVGDNTCFSGVVSFVLFA